MQAISCFVNFKLYNYDRNSMNFFLRKVKDTATKTYKFFASIPNLFRNNNNFNFWEARTKVVNNLKINDFYYNLFFRIRLSLLSNEYKVILKNESNYNYIKDYLVDIRELVYYLERDGFAIYDIKNKSFIDIDSYEIKNISKNKNGLYDIELGYRNVISNCYIFSYTFESKKLNNDFDFTDIQFVSQLIEKINTIDVNLQLITELLGKPVVQFNLTDDDLENLLNELNKNSFKLGDILFFRKDSNLEFKSLKIDNVKFLLEQRIEYLKLITSAIGIPIFLIGYPELMSNRATATEMLELIRIATKLEVQAIKKELQNFFYTILTLQNVIVDKDDITINYNVDSKYLIEEKNEILFRSYELGAISLQTFLENLSILNVDVSNEIEKTLRH